MNSNQTEPSCDQPAVCQDKNPYIKPDQAQRIDELNKAYQATKAIGQPIAKQLVQRPTIGRIVNFVQNGVIYAAMVVKVWTNTCVNLLVFPNGSEPLTPGAVDFQGIAHSVNLVSPVNTEWSWHWPDRA